MYRCLTPGPLFAAFCGLLLLGTALPADAQIVRGRVIEDGTDLPIRDARLTLLTGAGRAESRAVTDSTGTFQLHARFAGDYRVEVEHNGYAPLEPRSVRVEREQELVLEIRLSRSVMALDPLTVVARRRDPRHDATFEGALARHERFPSIGWQRVIMRDDVEFRTAMDVNDVLRMMLPVRSGACRIIYWNGRPVPTADREMIDEVWMRTSASTLEAVEFYRYYNDAPQGMRSIPMGIMSPMNCSVIALWPRLSPDPAEAARRFPGWVRFGAAAVAAVLLFVVAQ